MFSFSFFSFSHYPYKDQVFLTIIRTPPPIHVLANRIKENKESCPNFAFVCLELCNDQLVLLLTCDEYVNHQKKKVMNTQEVRTRATMTCDALYVNDTVACFDVIFERKTTLQSLNFYLFLLQVLYCTKKSDLRKLTLHV